MTLPLNLANSVVVFPLAHVGTLICNGKKKAASVSSLMESPVVIPPSIQQDLDEVSKAKDDNKKGIHSSDSCKEQSNRVRKHQNRVSEALDNEVMQLGSKQTVAYANECITGDGVANLEMDIKAKVRGHSSDVNPGKPSSSGNDIQLLVQTLYSLSEVLLSSSYYDTKELKEHDQIGDSQSSSIHPQEQKDGYLQTQMEAKRRIACLVSTANAKNSFSLSKVIKMETMMNL